MRFFAAASAALAFAASALAQTSSFNPVYLPAEDQTIQAGEPFTVTWKAPAEYRAGTVTISLIGGADQNTLVPLGDIATGVDNSLESYTWNVDAALGKDATYGLVFKWEANLSIYQYSMRFHIEGGSEEATSVAPPAKTEGVVTETTVVGTQTVTLTSCPPEEATSAPNGTVPATWSTKIWNTTAVAPTVIPTGVIPTTAPGAPDVTAPAPVPEGAATRFGAGLFAVFGGAAVAMLL
jgi:hypothetical protein